MVGVVLLSHSTLSEGMLEAIKLFFGDDIPQIAFAGLFPADDPEDLDERIRKAIEEVDDGHGVLLFTDLFGGTPANRSAYFLSDHCHVITGMNLGMIMEFLGDRMGNEDMNIEDYDVAGLIEKGREGIMHYNDLFKKTNKEEEN